MADVVHRTTLEYLRSVNTPEYPVIDWIINPNLSALAAVPQRYWKVSGDLVVEMTAGEKTAKDAADAAAIVSSDQTVAKADCDLRAETAIVQTLVDEINVLRQWLASFKVEVAAASNLADLKTRVATLPATADRTYVQARTAIRNRIDSL